MTFHGDNISHFDLVIVSTFAHLEHFSEYFVTRNDGALLTQNGCAAPIFLIVVEIATLVLLDITTADTCGKNLD